jgi:hypothetical protein
MVIGAFFLRTHARLPCTDNDVWHDQDPALFTRYFKALFTITPYTALKTCHWKHTEYSKTCRTLVYAGLPFRLGSHDVLATHYKPRLCSGTLCCLITFSKSTYREIESGMTVQCPTVYIASWYQSFARTDWVTDWLSNRLQSQYHHVSGVCGTVNSHSVQSQCFSKK